MSNKGARSLATTDSSDFLPDFDRAWAVPAEPKKVQDDTDKDRYPSTFSIGNSATRARVNPPTNLGRTKSALLRGSCACRKVCYTSTSPPVDADNCHCEKCRKVAGAPYCTWANVPTAGLTWSLPPTVFEVSKIAKRGFCHSCGSTLTMFYYCQPDKISITVGTIDENEVEIPKPTAHIFLEEKARWFDVPNDGLNRYNRFPPAFQAKLDAWEANAGKE